MLNETKHKELQQSLFKAITSYMDTSRTDISEKFSNVFIKKVTKDSYLAKQNLRELFKTHPKYNENLDAILIDFNQPHEPDEHVIKDLLEKILEHVQVYTEKTKQMCIGCFTKYLITGDKRHLPPLFNTHKTNKKPIKVLREIFITLGVYNEQKGSSFQKYFAYLSNEVKPTKKTKLIVSLNAAHILTMSNPADDRRGETLVTCHSINDPQSTKNTGPLSLTLDEVTFIAFTVNDPNNEHDLNTRKTSRCLFHYDIKSTLLLQNRLYSSEPSLNNDKNIARYRQAVQSLISSITSLTDDWKTYDIFADDTLIAPIKCNKDYHGFSDLHIKESKCKMSIHASKEIEHTPYITIGEATYCPNCMSPTSENILCDECNTTSHFCGYCGEYFEVLVTEKQSYDRDHYSDTYNLLCHECALRRFTKCDYCGTQFLNNDSTGTQTLCDYCK